MSNKREREKRREERLREETKVASQDRRTRLLQLGAGAVFLAIIVVVVLIVVNSGGSDSGGNAEELQEVAAVEKLFKGIEQSEMTLGDPKAPVELTEFGDLQCPVCKQYSEEILPPIIEGQVKQGQVKITFKNFVIIGPESIPAGQAALAAGEQGVGWNFLELFYRNQGKERSGYVTEEFIEAVGEGAGVKDMASWNKARKSKSSKKRSKRRPAKRPTNSTSTERRRSRSRARARTGSNCSARPARPERSKKRSTTPAERPAGSAGGDERGKGAVSNKREREKRREERLREETKVASQDRRTRLLQLGAGAVFLAIIVVVVLIVVNSGGSAAAVTPKNCRKSPRSRGSSKGSNRTR